MPLASSCEMNVMIRFQEKTATPVSRLTGRERTLQERTRERKYGALLSKEVAWCHVLPYRISFHSIARETPAYQE